jgi:hypothetical protein
MSNLRPVEARAFELASVALLSQSHAKMFSPSSRRVINKMLPLLVCSPRTMLITYPHLSSHPPWNIDLSRIAIPSDGTVSLYPVHDRLIRFYVVASATTSTVASVWSVSVSTVWLSQVMVISH